MSIFKRFLIVILVMCFLTGVGLVLWPTIHNIIFDISMKQTVEFFQSQTAVTRPIEQGTSDTVPSETIPEETLPDTYTDLWIAMKAYNNVLYESGQENLKSLSAVEQSCFKLVDYGAESEVFGVISIPRLNLEMPIYLGASEKNMSLGAAQMGQTSIPIGGKNTNCVIAGHRGWGGADYFRYITELEPGDKIQITNLWETLSYQVSEVKIINPNDVDAIKIQHGRDLITLFTCHPYASGGRQRYLVLCERS